MLKFMSLKAEGVVASSSNDAGQQEESGGVFGWIKKLDNNYAKLWSEKQQKPSSDHDMTGVQERNEMLDAYYKDRSSSTWRERLNLMWSKDEYGMPSPELDFVIQSTKLSFFFGLCYGAFQETAKIHRIFLEQNKYTMFQHPREAQRALQERIILAGIQGGWRIGWRLGLLNFMFISVSQSLVVIRNYVNPLDFAAGGAVMGSIYKVNMGPKGMVGAGFVGSVLGLQAGVLIWGLQKLSGETVEERWAREYDILKHGREEKDEVAVKSDYRTIVKEEEEFQESQTGEIIEENDWVRNLSLKLTKLLKDAGFLKGASEDSFRLTDEEDSSNSIKVTKVDLENVSESSRTKPDSAEEESENIK